MYNSNASIQVMLFRDRLEIWNPGRLPFGLTTAKLRGPYPSIPGNPLLAEPMYLSGYIERMGTGTGDIIRLCKEAGLRPPEFIEEIATEVLETGQERALSAQHMRHRDPDSGVERDYWFDIVYTPIHDGERVVGVASFGFDVSDLVKARQATEALLVKKDEFMSIASHELKTPITSLKGSLQILAKLKPTDEGSKRILPFIDRANKQTDKLIALVEELLDVTRIQAGKMLLNHAAFNLRDMVRESVNEVQLQCTTHRISLECDRDIPAYGDRSRLEQVMHNFLSNAIKYSPDAHAVQVSCALVDGEVKVAVRDFGIGIAEEKKKHLFSRYYRVHDTSSYFTGLGLGLYISAEIVRRHGGQVGLESQEGEGSVFWFSLPLDQVAIHND